MNVFVYGTLKLGKSNHDVMIASNGVYKGAALSQGWIMHDMGYFPAITPGDDNNIIGGELWSVDSLDLLDQLEGYPNFYNRKKCNTTAGEAWIYYLDESSDPIINDGFWRE